MMVIRHLPLDFLLKLGRILIMKDKLLNAFDYSAATFLVVFYSLWLAHASATLFDLIFGA